MQTALADFIRDTPEGREADGILRACVHCGFCTATCPTYQLLGDELDGPRGRIYQIKQVLEGEAATVRIQQHLDRCLTCRSCETTCPSGVRYGRLLEIGREAVEHQVGRRGLPKWMRRALLEIVPYRGRFGAALRLGRLARPLLPATLKAKVPPAPRTGGNWPAPRHPRRILMLTGCVQPNLAPEIDLTLTQVLDRVGLSAVVTNTGCCGALPQHLSELDRARAMARHNIDTWWPEVEAGAEAIVVTASGCGVTVREYGYLLAEDLRYREKAARVADMVRDPVEILDAEDLRPLGQPGAGLGPVAVHAPCTLQHGMQLGGRVEAAMRTLGFELVPVADGHLCCGSAGSYSLLQPELSSQLKRNKLRALTISTPQRIATANIGCLLHLSEDSPVPVHHWLELIARHPSD
jgi:glycolate oxidase iron-sulfur subunit